MPTRSGKKAQKTRDREHTHRELEPKDKARKNPRKDDWEDEINQRFDAADVDMDSSHSDDVMGLFDLDDLALSRMNIADDTGNRRSGRNIHRTTSQVSTASGQTRPYEPLRTRPKICIVEELDLTNSGLPPEIYTIFTDVKSLIRLREALMQIHDEEKRYLEPKDEHGNRMTPRKRKSFPRQPIVDHFQKVKFTDFKQPWGKQILEYLRKPVLKKASYGILLYNSKRQILAVQSHSDVWSPPKGHRRVKDKYNFETIKETAARKFNEEIRVTNLINNQQFDFFGFDEKNQLNMNNYVEFVFEEIRRGDNGRHIGIFIFQIDDNQLAFNLPDTFENQACQWLELDTVLDPIPPGEFDIYYILRPFAEWLRGNRLH